jgi:hypothetical protein
MERVSVYAAWPDGRTPCLSSLLEVIASSILDLFELNNALPDRVDAFGVQVLLRCYGNNRLPLIRSPWQCFLKEKADGAFGTKLADFELRVAKHGRFGMVF